MSASRQELLRRIEGHAAPGAIKRIRALFGAADGRAKTLEPVRTTVNETLRLWETRLVTSGLPVPSLNGIRLLVRKLRTLSPEAGIEQYGLTGKEFAGSIFFDRASGEFLGDTIVKRRKKSRETQDLESRFVQPSRKSA
jgi:hypothetical protein